jgi:hypothetical protein
MATSASPFWANGPLVAAKVEGAVGEQALRAINPMTPNSPPKLRADL